jgi:hypothetical protein
MCSGPSAATSGLATILDAASSICGSPRVASTRLQTASSNTCRALASERSAISSVFTLAGYCVKHLPPTGIGEFWGHPETQEFAELLIDLEKRWRLGRC